MSVSMSDAEVEAYQQARLALLKQIERAAGSNMHVTLTYAKAYRYLDGGPQPGSEAKDD